MSAGPHGYELVHLRDRAAWRRWLERNHGTAKGVWVVSWRAQTGKPRVDYDALVQDALCFGWIDGHQKPVDDERIMQLITPRRAGSAWASSNKKRVASLEQAGAMTEAGRRVVEAAKADGSWSRYDSADALEIPTDLKAALARNAAAARNFRRVHRRSEARDPALAHRREAAGDAREARRRDRTASRDQ